ncbi:hypothetical protein GGR19_002516 [Croceicoccus naphthovorans]|nr:hypothetical protein [Croceicoccus naphthovorans]MBB3991081.1 hypothetical protein [Croceicoccus naphthovorans]
MNILNTRFAVALLASTATLGLAATAQADETPACNDQNDDPTTEATECGTDADTAPLRGQPPLAMAQPLPGPMPSPSAVMMPEPTLQTHRPHRR